MKKELRRTFFRFVAEILLIVSTVGAMHHLVSNHFSIDSHLSLVDLSFQAGKLPTCDSNVSLFYQVISLLFKRRQFGLFFVAALSFKLVSLKS